MVNIRLNPVGELPVRGFAQIFELRKVGRTIAAADAAAQEAIDSVSVERVCESPPSTGCVW